MKFLYFTTLLLAACSSPEDKALRSGQYSMHPTNSPRVDPPMVVGQPERNDALSRVSNPSSDDDKHNADINREKDKSRAGE